MSAPYVEGEVFCPNCESDNTDFSIGRGSCEYDEGSAWDEGWKCRDCGARFDIGRAFTQVDYCEQIEAWLNENEDAYEHIGKITSVASLETAMVAIYGWSKAIDFGNLFDFLVNVYYEGREP